MHATNAILTKEMLTKRSLLVMIVLEISQINRSRDLINLFHSDTKRIAWYSKVSLILILLRVAKPDVAKYQISEVSTIVIKTRKSKLQES